jgi:hypothetical protein
MFSVLYECEGTVYQIGPVKSEDEATAAARKAQSEGEFDIRDQRVYLMHPDHRFIEYSEADLMS